MEHGNNDAEKQVWQRVFAPPQPAAAEDLRPLLLAAMELAAAYRSLLSGLQGDRREQAVELYRGERANIQCLRGLETLQGKGGETLKIWSPARAPLEKTLTECYWKSRQCLMEYMARSAQPEYGVVFQTLARREEKQCAAIAALLGSSDRQK